MEDDIIAKSWRSTHRTPQEKGGRKDLGRVLKVIKSEASVAKK